MTAFVKWLRHFWPRIEKPKVSPWLVDRDGRVYLPTRRVELRASKI